MFLLFVGENGIGKSTLLEALAVAVGFNPEGGGKNFRFATRASQSELGNHLRASRAVTPPHDGWFLRAESFYNVATQIEQLGVDDAYGSRSLHEQSHGESFAVFRHRFGARGLHLLDEPEAALSPQWQIALLARMHQLVQDGSQFLVATHAPILMASPAPISGSSGPAASSASPRRTPITGACCAGFWPIRSACCASARGVEARQWTCYRSDDTSSSNVFDTELPKRGNASSCQTTRFAAGSISISTG